MRSYALSIFIHSIVFALAIFATWESPKNPSAKDLPLYVEMISQPLAPSSAMPKARKPQASRQKMKPKKTKAQIKNKDMKNVEPKKTRTAQATSELSAETSTETGETSEASNSETSTSKTRGTSARTLSYAEELKVYLEKNKHYPRQALRLKQSGTVLIKVKIGSSGMFSDLSIANPSSSPILNQAALDLFVKLRAFKPLPKDLGHNSVFTIPIAYVMGG